MLQPQGVTVGSLNLASMEDMEFAQNLGEWLYSRGGRGGGGGELSLLGWAIRRDIPSSGSGITQGGNTVSTPLRQVFLSVGQV